MRKYCYFLICIFCFIIARTNLTSQQIVEPQWILPEGNPIGFTEDKSQVYFETKYGIGFSNSIYEIPEVFNSGKPFENLDNKYTLGVNGKYLLHNTYNSKTVSDSATEFHVWDVGIKKKIYTLRFMSASCSISRTDKYLIVWQDYKRDTVFIYDFPTGRMVKKMAAYYGTKFGFSPKDGFFYIIDTSNVLRVWKTSDWEYLSTFESVKIDQIDFSSDESKIAVVEKDSVTVKIFNTENMSQWQILSNKKLYNKRLNSVKFSNDITRLVTTNSDATISVWDVENEKIITTLFYNSPPTVYNDAYIVLGNNSYLVSFVGSRTVVWDIRTGKVVHTYENITQAQILRNAPKDELYIYDFGNKSIYKWTNHDKQLDVDTAFCLGSNEYFWWGIFNGQIHVSYEVDSNFITLLCGSIKQKIDIDKRKIVSSKREKRGSLTLKNDRYALFVENFHYEIWDIIEEKKMYEMEILESKTPMALSSDGRKIACGNNVGDGEYAVIIYDFSLQKIIIDTDNKGLKLAYITKLIFNEMGNKLLIQQANKVTIWDQNAEDSLFVVYNGYSKNAIFSHNDKNVTVAEDKDVIVIDIETKELKYKFEHDSGILGWYSAPKRVVYNDDNTLVATSYYDNNVYIWDALNGQKISTLPHTYPISNVTFSKKNRHVLTAGTDGNAYMWDIDKSNLLKVFHAESDTLILAKFSNDESKVIGFSVRYGSGCIIWDIGKKTSMIAEDEGADIYCTITPNPSNNSATITLGNEVQNKSPYTVYNNLGEKALNGEVPEGNTTFVIEIGGLSIGMYIFTSEVNGKRIQEKFVVMR